MKGPLAAAEVAALLDVSRETLDRLARHLELLERWQRRINLVGRGSLDDPWRRHVLDSGQLSRLLPPGTRRLIDLGASAGFPGLVLAIMGVAEVHLVEADRRKAAFLREAARVTGTRVTVHPFRAESLAPEPFDVVTARALAPLPRLVELAAPFMGPAGVALFPKGAGARRELTEAAKAWHMTVRSFPSLSDPSGVVLELSEVSRGPASGPANRAG
jgi:16S rRNA (guanine527-N7)-methyltransferase